MGAGSFEFEGSSPSDRVSALTEITRALLVFSAVPFVAEVRFKPILKKCLARMSPTFGLESADDFFCFLAVDDGVLFDSRG